MDSLHGYSRRTFLGGAAGLGIAGLGLGALAGPRLHAQTRPHRIDVHHHLFTPEFRAASAAVGGNTPPWTVEQSLAEMDRNGIQTALLSINPPGIWLGDLQQSRRLARGVNEFAAKMRGDHAGRYGQFTVIPLPDVEGSLREIEYGYDTLKADGIAVMTNYGDRWLGDASFAPVWEELNRRKAVVYSHPVTANCCKAIKDEVPVGSIEWPTDTTRTIASLVFSGAAARYPEIRWIFSHGGGTLPFLLGRFLRQEREMKEKAQRLPNGLMHELNKFYYDTAQAVHPGALAALLKFAPVSQVLYGTDYPFSPGNDENEGLSGYHFPAADLAAIERGNALRLLPGVKG
ncbi:MAG: amidohydrolase [Bryobacterales bacterium]|nr:amidohydrolase [Bryobacterales bacterium]